MVNPKEFIEAAARGDVDLVRYFLRTGVNPNIGDKKGTALHAASTEGHYMVVLALLNYNSEDTLNGNTYNHRIKVDSRNSRHETPLHNACEMGHEGIVGLLLSYNADVGARDMYASTPLHHASRMGHAKIVSMLLKAGAFINSIDKFHWTALHEASGEGQVDVVRLLVQQGADVQLKNSLGKTAYDLAKSSHNTALPSLLQNPSQQQVLLLQDRLEQLEEKADFACTCGNLIDDLKKELTEVETKTEVFLEFVSNGGPSNQDHEQMVVDFRQELDELKLQGYESEVNLQDLGEKIRLINEEGPTGLASIIKEWQSWLEEAKRSQNATPQEESVFVTHQELQEFELGTVTRLRDKWNTDIQDRLQEQIKNFVTRSELLQREAKSDALDHDLIVSNVLGIVRQEIRTMTGPNEPPFPTCSEALSHLDTNSNLWFGPVLLVLLLVSVSLSLIYVLIGSIHKRHGPFKDAAFDKEDEDSFPLHCAVKYGYQADIQDALDELHNDQNDVLNAVDSKGRTAVDLAALTGQLDVVNLLLDKGCEFRCGPKAVMKATARTRQLQNAEYLAWVRSDL